MRANMYYACVYVCVRVYARIAVERKYSNT